MKFFFKVSLSLFLFWGIHQFCHQKTDGFQISKISSHLSPSKEWETPLPSEKELEDLKKILSQPFSYLASGGQCYAFLSKDQKIVLKLYKMHHLRQYPLLYRLCLPGIFDQWRLKFLLFQKQKLQGVFSSSSLAYTQLKEETGLLYLNLNPSVHLKNLQVTLIDKIGISHHLPLAQIPFALQYRADNPFKRLRSHLLHRDLNAGKKVVDEIFECLTTRYEKGIKDQDPALRRNIGLLKDRAIAIDIGSFSASSTTLTIEEKKQGLLQDTHRMRRWLQKRSLELMNYLDQLIESYGKPSESISQKGKETDDSLRKSLHSDCSQN